MSAWLLLPGLPMPGAMCRLTPAESQRLTDEQAARRHRAPGPAPRQHGLGPQSSCRSLAEVVVADQQVARAILISAWVFYRELLLVYEAGRFPCGWHGTYPRVDSRSCYNRVGRREVCEDAAIARQGGVGAAMDCVRIHPEFGIVLRRSALRERGVSLDAVLAVFQRAPLDQNGSLISFGPHFGQEAASALVASLEKLGLVYVDDLFMFVSECPDWCGLGAACVDEPGAAEQVPAVRNG